MTQTLDRRPPPAPAACMGQTGYIGIGNMGLAMALRSRDAGWAVRVHDIDADRLTQAAAAGCEVADGPATLASGCRRLVVVVVDAAQTAAVLFGGGGQRGAADALPPGATVLLCPTIGPVDTESLGARLLARGLRCLDAPMSGGPQRARAGEMSLMVAGDAATVAGERDFLDWQADPVFAVGERLGDGARTKLVNNLLAATHLAAAAEALALAERLGLDAGTTLSVVQRSSGQSWIGGDRLARALAEDFAPRAHGSLLAKDTGLAVAMAQAAGIGPLRLGEPVAELFSQLLHAGWGDQDDARMLSLMRQHLAAAAAGSVPAAAARPVPPPDAAAR